jgi:ribosomal protein S18 acetylase RimI-like enzyme
MARPDPYTVVEQNLRRAMRFYAQAPPEGEQIELDGLLLISSGINFGPFNAAMITSPCRERDIEERLDQAGKIFGERGLRWSCWVCDDLLEGDLRRTARRLLSKRGMLPLTEPPGMLAERIEPVSRWLPDLECRRVASAGTRMAFCEITSIVFEVPFSVSQRIYDSERAWTLGLNGWVGYVQGRAVVTAATLVAAGAVGVYSVATLPRYRKQGYAEALMRRALAEATAETGVECTVLQTTRAGLHMYERMGYRPVTSFSVYMAG